MLHAVHYNIYIHVYSKISRGEGANIQQGGVKYEDITVLVLFIFDRACPKYTYI